jgi:hypothetical protein
MSSRALDCEPQVGEELGVQCSLIIVRQRFLFHSTEHLDHELAFLAVGTFIGLADLWRSLLLGWHQTASVCPGGVLDPVAAARAHQRRRLDERAHFVSHGNCGLAECDRNNCGCRGGHSGLAAQPVRRTARIRPNIFCARLRLAASHTAVPDRLGCSLTNPLRASSIAAEFSCAGSSDLIERIGR